MLGADLDTWSLIPSYLPGVRHLCNCSVVLDVRETIDMNTLEIRVSIDLEVYLNYIQMDSSGSFSRTGRDFSIAIAQGHDARELYRAAYGL